MNSKPNQRVQSSTMRQSGPPNGASQTSSGVSTTKKRHTARGESTYRHDASLFLFKEAHDAPEWQAS
jgi:hypothetical protein